MYRIRYNGHERVKWMRGGASLKQGEASRNGTGPFTMIMRHLLYKFEYVCVITIGIQLVKRWDINFTTYIATRLRMG